MWFHGDAPFVTIKQLCSFRFPGSCWLLHVFGGVFGFTK